MNNQKQKKRITEEAMDNKVLELACKYYPKTREHWSERHRAVAMFGEFIYWLNKNYEKTKEKGYTKKPKN